MGTLVGHVLPRLGFFLIGLWHLYNHIKLYSLRPKAYVALSWFPTLKHRHLELKVILGGSLVFIVAGLFIGPAKHQPFDSDGTIPTNHLHNFELAVIAFTFLVYASFALCFDIIKMKMSRSMTQILAGIAFPQEYLMFYVHSTDHMGIEGQYHWLLQLVIMCCLATTLIGIAGIWSIVMGIMIWIPYLLPKECYLNNEDGHQVPRCHSDEAMHRAKALINMQFSLYLLLTTVFCMLSYIYVSNYYPEEPEYVLLVKGGTNEEEDLEAK
ncbi:hypothetical protein LUZ61_000250 [Rhynchospora tenuis]|uniref:Uncharacterized protein n=1 Tax=Rhynchospora tenuis TaxID=198213 RepID=A0AAD5ZEP4_9POAL|nr:hypothetical protein LUZ61_000250 [Rhynchospora tenuis]